MEEFEKLGVFYLGRNWEPQSGKVLETPFLVPSRDLTTHAVIVGMTGSGKTGLGISLLEEALIDNIPVIAIDPKGDLGNLFLCFPELSARTLLPWVNPFEAAANELSPHEFAARQAKLWEKGRASWGQSPERARKLRQSVDFRLYTPGGSAGNAVNVMAFLGAPAPAVRDDAEMLASRARTAVSALLGLLEIESDPLSGRESVFLSNLLLHFWERGQSPDLGALIAGIQKPPFDKLGFLDLETTFPAKDRFRLAIRLNQLAAAPGFQTWGEGDPLRAEGLLYGAGGRPRASVFSLSHLSARERMFFVTLLLGELVAWMRSQPGTSSLRALLYMDEIWGYLPPVQNPPSKEPLLLLLKQARAAGLGVVLSTQNPVDLDYKALSNAGTWFIGRLQTERDKDRLKEGLRYLDVADEGAPDLDRQISALSGRVFIHRSVHDPRPTLFHTRWTLSYLAGPLSREQMKKLASGPDQAEEEEGPAEPLSHPVPEQTSPERPLLPADLDCFTVSPAPARQEEELLYVPRIVAALDARYHRESIGLDHPLRSVFAVPVSEGPIPVDWSLAEVLPLDIGDLARGMPETGRMEPLPPIALDPGAYKKWGKDLLKWYRLERPLILFKSPRFKIYSEAEESEDAFRARLGLKCREKRDLALDKLKSRYAKKLETLQSRIFRAEQALERESEQAGQKRVETLLSFGTALASVVLGRRITATSASRTATALSRAGRARKEKEDVRRAGEKLEILEEKLRELQLELREKVAELEDTLDPASEIIEEVAVKAKSTNLSLLLIGLAWFPCVRQPDGRLIPAWK